MWILTDKLKRTHFASRTLVLICSLKLEMHNATYFGCALIHTLWLQQDLYPLTVFSHYSEPPQQREETVLTSPILPAHPGECVHENVTPNEILMNALNHNEIIATNAQIHQEPFYYLNKAHTEVWYIRSVFNSVYREKAGQFKNVRVHPLFILPVFTPTVFSSELSSFLCLKAVKMHHLKATGSHPTLWSKSQGLGLLDSGVWFFFPHTYIIKNVLPLKRFFLTLPLRNSTRQERLMLRMAAGVIRIPFTEWMDRCSTAP